MYKHRGGRNARWFAPEGLRELAPAERIGAAPATYVALQGLGKVAHANIRRPKPLMDVADAPKADGAGGPGSEARPCSPCFYACKADVEARQASSQHRCCA